jgi:hypothetical protein
VKKVCILLNYYGDKMRLEKQLADSLTISSKVKSSEVYAQNLYAAFCNMQWRKESDLSQGLFAVTWRTAGGIVANLRGNGGSYSDWYCSGIGPKLEGKVPEGTVTDEIKQDLLELGWQPIPYDET